MDEEEAGIRGGIVVKETPQADKTGMGLEKYFPNRFVTDSGGDN